MNYSYENIKVTVRKIYNWIYPKGKRTSERMMARIIEYSGIQKSQPVTLFHFANYIGSDLETAYHILNDASPRPWPPPSTKKIKKNKITSKKNKKNKN